MAAVFAGPRLARPAAAHDVARSEPGIPACEAIRAAHVPSLVTRALGRAEEAR
jgi:hypothetical protein